MSESPRSDSPAVHPEASIAIAWSVGDAFAVVLGCHVVLIVSSVVVFGIGGWASGSIPVWAQLLSLLPYWVVAIEASRRLLTRSGRSAADWLSGDRRVSSLVIQGSIGLAAGVVTSWLAIPALYAPLHRWWDTSPDDLERPARLLVEQADGFLGVAGLVLMTCVGAPLVEEVLYRGVLLSGLARFGGVVSVVVSSAVFAAVHLQPLQFVGLFVVGVVLAVLRRRTNGLAAPIAGHVGFNAVTVVMLLTQR